MAVVVEAGDGDGGGAVVSESELAIGSVVEVGTGAGTGVGVGAGAGTGALAGAGTSSSEARNFASAFRTRSGNGPDRVSAQFCSMRASWASIFSIVFRSSLVHVDNAAGFLLGAARVVVVIVGVVALAGACEASASRIANAARKFVIMLQIPSGNGPDWFNFHSNSIQRSLVSHCATVLSDMAGGCGCAGICCVVCAVCVNGALNG